MVFVKDNTAVRLSVVEVVKLGRLANKWQAAVEVANERHWHWHWHWHWLWLWLWLWRWCRLWLWLWHLQFSQEQDWDGQSSMTHYSNPRQKKSKQNIIIKVGLKPKPNQRSDLI